MTSCWKIKVTSEKITNYRVNTPSNHHYCQINIIVQRRSKILVIIHFFFFVKCRSKIFKLLKRVYSILTSLYQFDKKLTKHFPANIYMFKVRIVRQEITEIGSGKCFSSMKKTYYSLKRNKQDDGQLFQVHFQGEWQWDI